MKKFQAGIAFIIVFILGIFVGTKVDNFSFGKKEEKAVLASNKDIDFKEFAKDDEELTDMVSSEVEEESATETQVEEDADNDEDDDEDKEVSTETYLGTFDKEKCAELNKERELLYEESDNYSNTMAIADIDKQIVALNTYNFANKKIAFLGDSITLGYGGSDLGSGKYFGFDDYMQEMLDIGEIQNIGEGGSTIGRYNEDSCFEARAKDNIDDDVDIIIVMGGINDYIDGWENFGDTDHFNYHETYCGSVDTLVYTLTERWNTADVFMVTPYGLEIEQESADKGIEFSKFIEVQEMMAERYQFKRFHLFNLYDTGFLNTNDPQIKSELSADGTHLNNEGYKLLGQHIAADLVTYYGNLQ